jgi:hypothetical protein
MRKALVLISMALGACATAAPPETDIPVRGETPGYACRNATLDQFVGQPATGDISSRILQASGARTIRWVRPGMMITMDHRQDRVTAWQSPDNRVERIRCG